MKGALKTAVENVSARVAAAKSGRVTPNDLAPYLPLSLELIETRMREMVDGSTVLEPGDSDFLCFDYPEFYDSPQRELERSDCWICHAEEREKDRFDGPDTLPGFCSACSNDLSKEAMDLAETTAWPSAALKEHELLYITSSANEPVRLAAVAGKSRLTLGKVKQQLIEMSHRKWVKMILSEELGGMGFEFPKIHYSKSDFKQNQAFMRKHPSSMKDEVEVRLIKSLTGVAVILLLCIVGAIFHVPFPLIILSGVIASAIYVWKVISKRIPMAPDRI
jgi:hypothetical protein